MKFKRGDIIYDSRAPRDNELWICINPEKQFKIRSDLTQGTEFPVNNLFDGIAGQERLDQCFKGRPYPSWIKSLIYSPNPEDFYEE